MVSENKSSNDKFIGVSFRYGMIASILMILLTMLFFWISGAGSRPVIVWNHFILLIVCIMVLRDIEVTLKVVT